MDLSIVDIIILFAVCVAYFIKGFSGFGPALILVPIITLFYDPHTALMTSSFLDFLAGPILLVPVFRKIDWKFVIPITILLFIGAYIGIYFIKSISPEELKKIISLVLLVFIIFLVFQKEKRDLIKNKKFQLLRFPVSFLSGLSDGMTGISGPPLVLFFKLTTLKEYFRTQIIAVFTFGSFWRFFWYQKSGWQFDINIFLVISFVFLMLIGLWLGNRTQINVSETVFNRIVALILLIPVINIWLF